MKITYNHNLVNSFYMWFDHTLLKQGEAYSNKTTPLYLIEDERLTNGFNSYSAPFKQWVFDSSVTGAILPSGVTTDIGFLNSDSGIFIDYDNGRALIPTGYNVTNVSGSYAAKDFNTYILATRDEDFIFEDNFALNSRYLRMQESGVSPYDYVAPACFIMPFNDQATNKPFAFGGMDETLTKIRVLAISDDLFDLEGCISIFRDQNTAHFQFLNLSDGPINEYGDIKSKYSGDYSYKKVQEECGQRLVYISRVETLRLKNSINKRHANNMMIGIMDFFLQDPRFPRQEN